MTGRMLGKEELNLINFEAEVDEPCGITPTYAFQLVQPGLAVSGNPEEGDGMGRARGRSSRLGNEGVGSRPLAQTERVSIVIGFSCNINKFQIFQSFFQLLPTIVFKM